MPRRKMRTRRRDTWVPPYRCIPPPKKQRGAPCGAPRVFRPCVAQTEEGYIRRFMQAGTAEEYLTGNNVEPIAVLNDLVAVSNEDFTFADSDIGRVKLIE